MSKKQVINISAPCTDAKGKHYKGVTVHDGVNIEFVDNCAGGKAVKFSNTTEIDPPELNASAVSCPKKCDHACSEYLQLHPIV